MLLMSICLFPRISQLVVVESELEVLPPCAITVAAGLGPSLCLNFFALLPVLPGFAYASTARFARSGILLCGPSSFDDLRKLSNEILLKFKTEAQYKSSNIRTKNNSCIPLQIRTTA